MSDLGKLIDQVVLSSKQKDPEFSEAIKKWKRYLYSTTSSLSTQLRLPIEDAFNDLMVPLIRLYRDLYQPKYRYNKKVYDLVKSYGQVLLLRTSDFSKRVKREEFLIRIEYVDKVKKAKLSSQFFKKIQQEACVLVRKKYTQKNGYEVCGHYQEIAKKKGKDLFDSKFEVIDKKKVRRSIRETSIDTPISEDGKTSLMDVIEDKNYCMEELAEEYNILSSYRKALSTDALMVFAQIIDDPKASNDQLAETLDYSVDKVDVARREIELHTENLKGKKRTSIPAPYAIYKDEYYFLGSPMGQYQKLRLPSKEIIVPKSEVRIETEMAYRSPFHFKACDLC